MYTNPKKSPRLNEAGHEILSDKPVNIPQGFKIPESLSDQIKRLVQHEKFRDAMGNPDAETFEEADDFDVGDDFDPYSPYETVFDPVLNRDISPDEFLKNQSVYKKLYEKQAKEEYPLPPPAPNLTRNEDPKKPEEPEA